jgi:acyl-coenzyme A thioesterase PaaI-like protein
MNGHIQTQRTCFACGPEHPYGLGLQFQTEQQGVVSADWIPNTRWEGFRGIIHGGIVSTVLDEAMSKAVASTGTPGLTCQLEVRLRQTVAPDESVRVRAWVTERRKRRVRVESEIRDSANIQKAHATATFLTIGDVRRAEGMPRQRCNGSF